MPDNQESDATKLDDIRKLFVLLLIDKGYTQSQLSKVLGTSQAGISRLFPGGVPKKKDG